MQRLQFYAGVDGLELPVDGHLSRSPVSRTTALLATAMTALRIGVSAPPSAGTTNPDPAKFRETFGDADSGRWPTTH